MLYQGRAHTVFSTQLLIGFRKSPASWRLLCHLIQIVPLHNTARILTERKFTPILLQTLEEAQKAVQQVDTDAKETEINHESSLADEERLSKISKKRKRSGELVNKASVPDTHGSLELLAAIFEAISCLVRSTKTASWFSEEGRSAAFSTEYMKSVIRTSAEESAKILGSWLSLSLEALKTWDGRNVVAPQSWLSPFVEIWQTHATGDVDLMVFSLHCSHPLLSLLRAMKKGENTANVEWVLQLEQLIARNVTNPAKASREENAASDLLNTLTRISVLQDTSNAPILFDIAIRSLQYHGSRRRRPQDDSWLQTVFSTLKEALQPQREQENGQAMCEMLQSAIFHKVDLDLPALCSITSEYALPEGREDWKLLATIIELDANVFLIPSAEGNLLMKLLTRTTEASFAAFWPDISEKVVSKVVVPLVNAFAKARDLSGFIRHWYAQLVQFEKIRKNSPHSSTPLFSAWEDDALQSELSKLLEASLTEQQILQLLDWLSSQVAENPDAVCVILEAIAGSVSREETVDAINLRLYHIMFDNGVSEKLDGRYMWRSWRILSRTLHWVTVSGLDEIVQLWEERVKPFDSLCGKIGVGGLLEVGDGNTVDLEMLEFLRCASAAWSAAKQGSQLETLAKSAMLDFLQCLARDIKNFPRDLQSQQELGHEICGSNLNTLYRGIGWMLWSFVRCIFVEYPKTLE
jgi:nucleolar pre-ribosomal-associated protein 2